MVEQQLRLSGYEYEDLERMTYAEVLAHVAVLPLSLKVLGMYSGGGTVSELKKALS